MNYLKSKTNQATFAALIQALPGVTDPVWLVLSDAGMPDNWVSGLKVSAMVATAIYGIYGRKVAKGPL